MQNSRQDTRRQQKQQSIYLTTICICPIKRTPGSVFESVPLNSYFNDLTLKLVRAMLQVIDNSSD